MFFYHKKLWLKNFQHVMTTKLFSLIFNFNSPGLQSAVKKINGSLSQMASHGEWTTSKSLKVQE